MAAPTPAPVSPQSNIAVDVLDALVLKPLALMSSGLSDVFGGRWDFSETKRMWDSVSGAPPSAPPARPPPPGAPPPPRAAEQEFYGDDFRSGFFPLGSPMIETRRDEDALRTRDAEDERARVQVLDLREPTDREISLARVGLSPPPETRIYEAGEGRSVTALASGARGKLAAGVNGTVVEVPYGAE